MTPLYIGIPVVIGSGVLAGLLTMGLLKFVFRLVGHDGYAAESREQRAARIYMENAKQGIRE